jgi:beta-glucanase (GH16 family)
LIHRGYSLEHEKHHYTEGNNLEFGAEGMAIVVKEEKTDGLIWHQDWGFIERSFDFTSGLINTGKSFRQRYGWFEAKIRISEPSSIVNAFWMLGDKIMPHIEVMKADGKVQFACYTKDEQSGTSTRFVKKRNRAQFADRYCVFALEWLPEKINWRVNGVIVASTARDVPDEPMYLVISAGLHKPVNGSTLPAAMQVEYVRCYQRNDLL